MGYVVQCIVLPIVVWLQKGILFLCVDRVQKSYILGLESSNNLA
jgi:hypothetical protein